MGSYLVQVTFPHIDAAESADVVNTFHFRKNEVGPDNRTHIMNMVRDFYIEQRPERGRNLGSYLSNRIRRDQPATIKVYDDNALDPAGPLDEMTFAVPATISNSAMVEEVCLCLSFRGVHEAGMRPSSAAGRIYFGPLTSDANDGTTARPHATFVGTLLDSAIALHAASNDIGTTHKWVVYSPTLDRRADWTGPTDFEVLGGFVDNAWDTQRRRGLAPTTRSLWGAG